MRSVAGSLFFALPSGGRNGGQFFWACNSAGSARAVQFLDFGLRLVTASAWRLGTPQAGTAAKTSLCFTGIIAAI
jgi:hypothetical protein